MGVALNKCLENFEKNYLNFAGHYPLLSIPSGLTRVMYGNIQTTVAVAATTFSATGWLCLRSIQLAKTSQALKSDLKTCASIAWTAPAYIAHGIINMVRGCLEMSCVCGTILKDYDSNPDNRFSYSPVA